MSESEDDPHHLRRHADQSSAAPRRPAAAGSGRFTTGELLGSGGSASVYAAIDQRTGEDVALKVLHPHLAVRPAARDAFLAEARRMQELRHPNIVGVVDAGIEHTGGAPMVWIAFARAHGASLSMHVARSGALPPQDAAAVASGLLRALAAVHAAGMVHRDVSPSNVMVAAGESGIVRAEDVRLLDFGLAGPVGTPAVGTDDLLSVDATGRTGVLGNVNYMSPEQVRGAAVDERGDLYQAGAVLYFALTGHPPFAGEAPGQTMRAHIAAAPPRPSTSDSRIPRGLDRVVVRAMLKDPGDRFASAAAMRDALAAVDLGDRASAADASAHEVAAASPARPEEVTRVLGRTLVPARAWGTGSAGGEPAARVRSLPSRAAAWAAALAGAAVVAGVLVFAASSTPTASSEPPPEPTAAPSPEASGTPTPTPTPRATRAVEPVVALVAVPDLVGRTTGEAENLLVGWGLVRGEVTVVDSPYARDLVLESLPAAGEQVGPGASVQLVVASGRNVVPELAGRTTAVAEEELRAAGFVPAVLERPTPSGSAAGVVVGMSPAAGTAVALGDTVTLFRSAPAAPTPTPTPTPAPTPLPTADR